MIKDYKSIFSPKFHLMVITLVVFQFAIWNTIFGTLDFYTTALLFELMIIGIPLITELYRRYNQPFFLKSNHLQDRSKRELQVMLFVIVFVDMWIVVFYHIIINYLFQDVFNLVTPNVAGNLLLIHYEYLNSFNTLFPLFLFIFLLITSIVAMTYFLNHYIKNKMFIYGLLIAFLGIEVIFGPLLNWQLFDREKIEGEFYIVNGNYSNPIFTVLTLLIVPWNYFAFMVNFILRRAEWVLQMPVSAFWDNTYLDNAFKFVIWYPYVIMALYFIIPRLSREGLTQKIALFKNAFQTT